MSDWQKYIESLRKENAKLKAEVERLKKIERDWIEREALCCPEGVSFEENLKSQQAVIDKAIDILRNAENFMSRHQLCTAANVYNRIRDFLAELDKLKGEVGSGKMKLTPFSENESKPLVALQESTECMALKERVRELESGEIKNIENLKRLTKELKTMNDRVGELIFALVGGKDK